MGRNYRGTLPTNDYWYSVEYSTDGTSGLIYKSLALKR
jgi:hypothetical protein